MAPPQEDAPTSPLGHRVLFVVLALLAFGLFAPTVLVPLLREHARLQTTETRLAAHVADMRAELERRRELLDAFRHDTLINERLALLDLNYHRLNEIVLPVYMSDRRTPSAATEPHEARNSLLSLPPDWPAWTHRAEAWATDRGLTAVFLNEKLRPVFLLMAAGLIIAAFVLFAPRPQPA
ncbi:MAG: hypothetical protein ACE5F9_00955, partial [Phycisphaerae bacterium]